MNKFLIVALVGLACLLVAKCEDEDALHGKMKEAMDKYLCQKENPEGFMTCADMMPEEVKKVIESETGKNMKEAMEEFCIDPDKQQQVCDKIKENEELKMKEGEKTAMMECLDNL